MPRTAFSFAAIDVAFTPNSDEENGHPSLRLCAISDIDDGTGVAVVERCRPVCDVGWMIRVLSLTSR
jgi:hypothetical protein